MKKFLVLVLVCFLALPGCIPASVFPAVAAVVSDASAVLNIIQRAVDSWFSHKPDPELQDQINANISETWSALRVATAITSGAENLSQEEYDAAFKDFQDSYSRLHALLKRHGILNGTTLSAGPNQPEYDIPEPLAMSYEVE